MASNVSETEKSQYNHSASKINTVNQHFKDGYRRSQQSSNREETLRNDCYEYDETDRAMPKMSYLKGDTSEPLKYITIGQLLEESVSHFAHRVAISFYKGEKLSYAEVLKQSDALAAAFVSFGLKRGDHVAVWAFNSIEWYLSFLGIARAGLVAVNLNPLYEGPELRSRLINADVKAIIMNDELNGRYFYNILRQVMPEIDEYDCNTSIKKPSSIPLLNFVVIISDKSYKGTYRFKDVLMMPTGKQKSRIRELQEQINIFDACNMQFTSGTTSEPKGVLLTHFGIVNNAHFTGKYLNLSEKEHKSCIPVPFFHTLGTVAGLVASINYGVTLILPWSKFSPTKTLDCIIDEKCTVVYGTPTMYLDMLNILKKRSATCCLNGTTSDKSGKDAINNSNTFPKITHLERFFSGGAICLPDLIQKLKKYFSNVEFSSGYGMTEILSPFMSLPNDSIETRLTTVGRIMDHVEVKIVNEKYNMVPLGMAGELCCRGYSVTKGYYKDEKKTKACLSEDGWFRTGDRFVFLENGYAQIIGRIKDTVIRGGENIEPKEIEQVLSSHPDIVDAQVYGVSCQRLGEVVAASIVKTDGSDLCDDDVRNFCRGIIAPYKIPEYIIFVTEFPKTATGKIQKFELRRITEEKIRQERERKNKTR